MHVISLVSSHGSQIFLPEHILEALILIHHRALPSYLPTILLSSLLLLEIQKPSLIESALMVKIAHLIYGSVLSQLNIVRTYNRKNAMLSLRCLADVRYVYS